jgi:AraC family ethanolamine operon transcriptional activator
MSSRHSPDVGTDSMCDPAVTVVDITDPTAVGDTVEVLDQDVVDLDAKPFRVKRVTVRLEENLVVFQATSSRLRTHTRVQDGLLAFAALGPRARGTFDGLTIESGVLLAAAPGAQGMFVVEPGYESVTIMMPPAVLERHIRGRGRRAEFRLPAGAEIWRSDAARVGKLFDLGKRIAEIAAQEPEIFNNSVQARINAQIELFEALFSTLDAPVGSRPTQRDKMRQAYSEFEKTCESRAMSMEIEKLYVTDLCEAAGVSERTLQYAFQDIMGMTPMAYLKRLRLHRVREAIRNTAIPLETVTSVAYQWGFFHMGEFSGAYKDCFGELPSETFKRRCDKPRR